MNNIFDVLPEKITVGCRVVVLRDSDGIHSFDGLIGTVVIDKCGFYEGNGVGVDLDVCHDKEPHIIGHDLQHRLIGPWGRFFDGRDLQIIA